MAYTAPDAAAIKARFPEFDDVLDARIDFVIEEAMRFVDETWFEADYAPALRFLTAHMLVQEGALAASGGPSATVGPLTSQTLGDASESYGAKSSVVDLKGLDAELALTAYGQRFLELRNSNVPGVKIV